MGDIIEKHSRYNVLRFYLIDAVWVGQSIRVCLAFLFGLRRRYN